MFQYCDSSLPFYHYCCNVLNKIFLWEKCVCRQFLLTRMYSSQKLFLGVKILLFQFFEVKTFSMQIIGQNLFNYDIRGGVKHFTLTWGGSNFQISKKKSQPPFLPSFKEESDSFLIMTILSMKIASCWIYAFLCIWHSPDTAVQESAHSPLR